MSDRTDDLKVVLPQALNKGGGEGGDVVDKGDKGQRVHEISRASMGQLSSQSQRYRAAPISLC